MSHGQIDGRNKRNPGETVPSRLSLSTLRLDVWLLLSSKAQNEAPQETEVYASSFCGISLGIDQDICRERRSKELVPIGCFERVDCQVKVRFPYILVPM
jgi:hypothetical protein